MLNTEYIRFIVIQGGSVFEDPLASIEQFIFRSTEAESQPDQELFTFPNISSKSFQPYITSLGSVRFVKIYYTPYIIPTNFCFFLTGTVYLCELISI